MACNIIVCPALHWRRTFLFLKRLKGEQQLYVLHALKDLQKIGIDPDIVVHVDPSDLKAISQKRMVR